MDDQMGAIEAVVNAKTVAELDAAQAALEASGAIGIGIDLGWYDEATDRFEQIDPGDLYVRVAARIARGG